MRSEGYCSWFVCVCVCLSVCLSTAVMALQAMRQLMSDTNGFITMRSWRLFSRNDCVRGIWCENKRIKPIHAANNICTTIWTYLLALRQNQKNFNSQISLKLLPSKVRTLFAHLQLFGFYSPLLACTHAVTWCTRYMWRLLKSQYSTF